jgi:trimeric autotransporter adhesin
VNPDRNNVAPRFGLAWKPWTNHSTVVRSGYGIYYNGSVYNTAASRMAQQPPFAQTQSLNTSLENILTIADGFLNVPTKQVNNTYAIDRYYQVGYAQTWNASVQQNLPWSMVLEVGYLGTKGTKLDEQTVPNSAAPGSPLTAEERRAIGDAVGFIFDSSVGNSIYNAGQVRLSRRFRAGLSGQLFYTYSKSIDDASSIGGGGSVVAQNAWDLAAERGLSSFDHRHVLNASFLYSTSGAPGSASSRSVWLRDWQLSGGFTAQSGAPFTAMVLGNQSDSAGTGVVGSTRASATGIPLALSGYYFNPAAFTLPGNGQYGNAGRNTIIGPSSFTMNATFGRTIRLGERRNMDLRIEANNIFNNVNITSIGTTVNSAQYGLALAAGSMRSINLNVRFRF